MSDFDYFLQLVVARTSVLKTIVSKFFDHLDGKKDSIVEKIFVERATVVGEDVELCK